MAGAHDWRGGMIAVTRFIRSSPLFLGGVRVWCHQISSIESPGQTHWNAASFLADGRAARLGELALERGRSTDHLQ